MLILKTSNEIISVKVTFTKANKFVKTVCPENKGLMETLTDVIEKEEFMDFILDLIHEFQYTEVGVKPKTKEEITRFLDELLENNEEIDIYDIYGDILKEFDYSGVIKRGLGKQIANTLKSQMEKAIQEMGQMNNPQEVEKSTKTPLMENVQEIDTY